MYQKLNKVNDSDLALSKLIGDFHSGGDIKAGSVEYQWLKEGFLQNIKNPKRSLESCLRMSMCGNSHIYNRVALSIRNYFLLEACNYIDLTGGLSLWAQCQRLSKESNKLIPVWDKQKTKNLTSNSPTWKIFLFEAYLTGAEMPKTSRRLHQIVKSNDGFLFHDHNFKIYNILNERKNK